MAVGFTIVELRLTGPTVPDASIGFSPGLNVISGASNTGKTYIFQCLDYMFGGSSAPKPIVESRQYAYCHLTVEDSNGTLFTLKSDLKGGAVQLFNGNFDAIARSTPRAVLGRKHDDNKDENISQFFLSLCGLKGKKIKRLETGKKRGLSFRDLVRLSLVDEEVILTSKSVVLGGSDYDKTARINAFKFLLTGLDDSDLVEKMDAKEIANRRGKLEMLVSLITELKAEITAANIELDPTQLTNILRSEQECNTVLRSADQLHQGLVEQKRLYESGRTLAVEQYAELRLVESRSGILTDQYKSDAERLESTIEACQLFDAEKTTEHACPVCHKPLEPGGEGIAAVLEACQQELGKINLLRQELSASQSVLEAEINAVAQNIREADAQIGAINHEIETRVKNQINENLNRLANLQTTRQAIERQQLRADRVASLEKSKKEIEDAIKTRSGKVVKETLSSIIEPLNRQMLSVLQSCQYPDLTTVSFNEGKLDFVISGRDRELTGKGYRAITYAVFVASLQLHVLPRSYGICVPVLDSPLVTYQPATDEEGISLDLAMNFYRFLASSPLAQTIVLENEAPPADIADSINHIVFTGSTTTGRYGFFPAQSGS